MNLTTSVFRPDLLGNLKGTRNPQMRVLDHWNPTSTCTLNTYIKAYNRPQSAPWLVHLTTLGAANVLWGKCLSLTTSGSGILVFNMTERSPLTSKVFGRALFQKKYFYDFLGEIRIHGFVGGNALLGKNVDAVQRSHQHQTSDRKNDDPTWGSLNSSLWAGSSLRQRQTVFCVSYSTEHTKFIIKK